jgi:hypothetical protein
MVGEDMKELRTAIGGLEERIDTFQSGRAVDRTKLETAFNAWMLARHATTMRAGAVS